MAKSSALSAARKCSPGVMSSPSIPTVVATTGRPIAIASNALILVPLPTRSGMTHRCPCAT